MTKREVIRGLKAFGILFAIVGGFGGWMYGLGTRQHWASVVFFTVFGLAFGAVFFGLWRCIYDVLPE